MWQKRILIILAVFFVAGIKTAEVQAFLGIGQEKGKTQQLNREKGISTEKSREKTINTGKRQDESNATRISKMLSKAVRKSLQGQNSKGFQIKVNMLALVSNEIIKKEKENKGIFGKCRLYTHRPKMRDYGISWEENGVIYSNLKDYLEQSAKAQRAVETNRSIEPLIDCAVGYAEVMGSAVYYINEYIQQISKDWTGLEDIQRIVPAMIDKAIKKPHPVIHNLIWPVKSGFNQDCNFQGEISRWRCGTVSINWTPQLEVRSGSLVIFSPTVIAGLESSYVLNAGWSLARAWDTVRTKAESRDIMKNVVMYIDRMEKAGNVTKASLVKKNVLQMLKSGKISLNLNPLQR